MRWWPTTGLWRQPEFLKLWSAQTISSFGSRIGRDAIPMAAIIVLAVPESQIGYLAAAGMVPAVAAALFAGGLVDRTLRRRLLIISDLARAALLLIVPMAWLMDALTIWHLLAVAAGMGIFSTLFDLADNAYLPSLIAKRYLEEGNAKLSATDSAAEVGGPAISGLLVQFIGAPLALLFDALSYVGSAMLLGRIRRPEKIPAMAGAERGWRRNLRDLREGWRANMSDPVVRALFFALCSDSFYGGFFITLYYLNGLEVIGMSPAALGFTIAMGGVGALVGAVVSGRLRRRFRLGHMLVAAVIIDVFAMAVIGASGLVPSMTLAIGLLVVAQLFGDACFIFFFIQSRTLRQVRLSPDVLGRAGASLHVITGLLAPAGALIAGWLAQWLGTSAALFIAAGGGLTTLIWVASPPILALGKKAEEASI